MQATTARILAAGLVGVGGGLLAERLLTPGAKDRADAHRAQVEQSNLGEPARSKALETGPSPMAGLGNAAVAGVAALGVAGILGLASAMNFMMAGPAIGSLAKGTALLGAGIVAGAGASYALR